MNGGKIEIEGFYESRDFWRSALNYYFNFKAIYFFFLGFVFYGFILIFLFSGSVAALENFLNVVLFSILYVALYSFTMAYLAVGGTKRRGWGKHKFTFSSEKMMISADFYESSINWDGFAQIRETGNYFILVSTIGQKTLLPKRFFSDYEQLAEFKNLISSKLGEKAYLKKSRQALGLK